MMSFTTIIAMIIGLFLLRFLFKVVKKTMFLVLILGLAAVGVWYLM